jgi:hypothetical protein
LNGVDDALPTVSASLRPRPVRVLRPQPQAWPRPLPGASLWLLEMMDTPAVQGFLEAPGVGLEPTTYGSTDRHGGRGRALGKPCVSAASGLDKIENLPTELIRILPRHDDPPVDVPEIQPPQLRKTRGTPVEYATEAWILTRCTPCQIEGDPQCPYRRVQGEACHRFADSVTRVPAVKPFAMPAMWGPRRTP